MAVSTVFEFTDLSGGLQDSKLVLGKDDVAGVPTKQHPGGPDDGRVPSANCFTQLNVLRNIAGDLGTKRLGGLMTGLHRSRISEALLVADPTAASKAGPGALFCNAATGKLCYTDAKSVVHPLY